jgi:sulfite oxidase
MHGNTLGIRNVSRRRFLQAAAALAAAGAVAPGRVAWGAESDLIVRSADPLNAEPALSALVAANITAVKHFYVRNHGPLPKVDAASYKLRVEGMVHRPQELSLAEIKERFRQVTTEATLTCAGNRRQETSAIKPVGGVQWDAGAIGNASWTGARLIDVLDAAGIKEGAKHVWFEGLDAIKEKDGSVAPFGGSIPLQRAFDLRLSLPLAHAMNDAPLSAEHGFPLRAIVPGYIGARSVKWLSKITVSDRPSPNHYVAEAYKLIQSEDKDEVARAEPIYAFPVNAAICSPAAGAKLKAGKTTLAGYALPGGETGTVAKVEISRDGGRNWTDANLLGQPRPFAWQLWTAELDLPAGKHELVVCATDSRGNMMPERPEWNLKGYLYNGWHRNTVEAA